jgi:hypothetical protein
MANTNSCSGGIPAYACYDNRSINQAQRKALQVYALAKELAAAGGTDYTAVLATTLVSAACAWKVIEPGDKREAATTAVLLANAANAGASIPSSINDKIAAVKCIAHLDMQELDAIFRFLQCAKGYSSHF